MELYRGGSLSDSYYLVKSEEARIHPFFMDGIVRVDFTRVGGGNERHSDFAVNIDFVDVLRILRKMAYKEARDLRKYAYERGYYGPRYPVPTTISHWCNTLMTEVRKGGYL
jgi:hypothetical protein